MSREVFIVHSVDCIPPQPVLCTMSPSKAYKKAKELAKVTITRMVIDSLPCDVLRYNNIEQFYERYC